MTRNVLPSRITKGKKKGNGDGEDDAGDGEDDAGDTEGESSEEIQEVSEVSLSEAFLRAAMAEETAVVQQTLQERNH